MSTFRRLQPFAARWSEMRCEIDGQSDAELERIIEDAARVTKTNCWFATFEIAPMVSQHAKRELSVRREARKANPA